MTTHTITLSIVSPVYNEAALISEFFSRMDCVLQSMVTTFSIPLSSLEVVLINDGSSDQSLSLMQAHAKQNPTYVIVNLSRNFGHQAAITAGIEIARGGAVVVMDADLQDPPEFILELYRTHLKGYDVVYAVRSKREGETWFKKQTAAWFYKLLGKLSSVAIPQNTGDFRLMSRRVVSAFATMKERHRFIRGLVSFIGYPQIGIPYERQSRFAGDTKYPFSKMLRLGIDAITSFSSIPLKMIFGAGVLVAFIGFLYAVYVLIARYWLHVTIQGWSSLMIVILVLGGIQLIFIGLIGEYLAQIHDEVKARPLYIVESVTSASLSSSSQ